MERRFTSPFIANGRQTSESIPKIVDQIGFSMSMSMPMSRRLIVTLLVQSGIELNPGPWICHSCNKVANTNCCQCSICLNWVHLKRQCSQLLHSSEYNRTTFKCPTCATNNRPAQPIKTYPVVPQEKPPPTFNVLQFNINGLTRASKEELEHLLQKHEIHLAALQETKLKDTASVKFANYNCIRCDRNQFGGGLAFLVHKSLTYTETRLPQNAQVSQYTETQAIRIHGNHPITFINVYIPPVSSCMTGWKASIAHLLLQDDTIILGDFNAHDPLWYSNGNDSSNRGDNLAEEISATTYTVLNGNTPTRLPKNGNPTSPDISLASASLVTSVSSWAAETTLSSDHLPILIKLILQSTPITITNGTLTNFNRADWQAFTAETEQQFQQLLQDQMWPKSVEEAEQKLRTIVNSASKHHIPTGRRKNYIPCLSDLTKQLIQERDQIRKNDPMSNRLEELNQRINQDINDNKTRRWTDTIESIDHRKDPKRLWNIIKSLDGKTTKSPNCGIAFNDRIETCPNKIADSFNKAFTTVTTHKSSKITRTINRKVKARPLENPPVFTLIEVTLAIKKARNSKATGPDGITMLHLKHLGQLGCTYLTRLYNWSLSQCRIPAIWKTSTIIPLLKPNKDPKQQKSYRPVSLLCPPVKVLEALLLPIITEHLPPAHHQHGFRPKRSTVSALLHLTNTIADGFNEKKPPKRTIVAAIDLSSAFDTVNIDTLINIINNSTMPPATIRWMSAYLRGRQARTKFRERTSKYGLSMLVSLRVPCCHRPYSTLIYMTCQCHPKM